MSISVSVLHKHLVHKCKVTLKRLEKLPAARNTDQVISLRKEKVEEWENMQDMDCVKTVCSLMKLDSTCTCKETLVAL